MELLELVRKGLRVKGFVYVTVGNFVNAGLGFLFFFLAARMLGVESYGVLSYNISAGFLCITISVFGLPTAIMTFYPKEKNIELVRQAATLSFLLDAVASIVVLATVVFFKAPLLLAVLIIYGGTAFTINIYFALGRQDYKEYALINTAMRVGQLVLLLIIYLFVALTGWFISWLEELVLLGYAMAYLVAGYGYFKLLKFNFAFREIYAKWRFCLSAAVASMLTASIGSLDKVVIGAAFGMHALGNYHLAFQFLTGFMIIPTSLFSFLLPEKSVGKVRREVEVLGIAAATLVTLTGIVVAPYIVRAFFPDFEGSIGALQALSLAVVPASVAYIKVSELYSKERAGLVMVSYIVMFIVYLAGIMLLGGWLQTTGFAVSYTIGQAILAVTSYIFSTERWGRWEVERLK